MNKLNLALDNVQELICHKSKPNQIWKLKLLLDNILMFGSNNLLLIQGKKEYYMGVSS